MGIKIIFFKINVSNTYKSSLKCLARKIKQKNDMSTSNDKTK